MDKVIGETLMSNVTRGSSFHVVFALIIMVNAVLVNAEDTHDKVETLEEVSIMGNSELPALDFNLSWRLPSVESRKDHSLPKDIVDVLSPLEPKRHQQLIHFSRFLEVDTPRYKAQ